MITTQPVTMLFAMKKKKEPAAKPGMEKTVLYLRAEQMEFLRQLSKDTDRGISAMIRRAVDEFIEKQRKS